MTNTSFFAYLLKTSCKLQGTTCDPRTLKCSDLPNDSNLLIDRPEYWIVYKNFHDAKEKNLSIADELCFNVNEQTGNLAFSINGNLITNCLFNVDTTQKLWFFFDLCGKISAIRSIQCCSNQCEERNTSSENNFKGHSGAESLSRNLNLLVASTPKIPDKQKRRSRPDSALIEFYRNQLNYEDLCEFKSEGGTNSEKRRSSAKEECRVCWENPIECVLYSCGHMCLCWSW